MRIFLMIFCLVLGAGTMAWTQSPRVPARMKFADINLKIKDGARKEIQEDVDKLTRSPKFFNIHVQRARTYFPIIERIFKEEGVPEDIKYLVIQESALIADAVSSSDAVGFWQFKDFTAKEMGLRIDRQVDERMNIVSSSRAAAQYLKKNNNRYFDNWLVSLQAYQMGPGGALKAGGEKYKGHKSMTIDRGTYWYVKKFIAHKIAFEDALSGPAVINVAEYWKGANKSFKDISGETGISEDQLESYNKWLKRGKIPADKSYAVILPVTAASGLPIDYGQPAIAGPPLRGSKKPYAAEYEFADPDEFPFYSNKREANSGIVTEINGRKAIIARSGDRAVSLATKGDISLRKFYRFNDMADNERIKQGNIYYLQRKRSKQPAYHHIVQDGETFWSISQKYGIKMNKLLTRNRLRKEVPLKEGRILWLRYIRPRDIPVEYVRPEPVDVPLVVRKEKEPEREEEIIEEPLFAEGGNETVEVLVDNQKETESISQQEEIPMENEESPKIETSNDAEETVHSVKAGETLYSISRQYNVRIDDLLEWNDIDINDPIKINQKLRLHVKSTKEESKKAENDQIYYTVKSGDTFYSISREFGVSVDKLKELNNKKDNLLKPGERIRVQ